MQAEYDHCYVYDKDKELVREFKGGGDHFKNFISACQSRKVEDLNADVREALEIINASKMTSENLFHTISEIHLRKGHDLVLYSFETGAPIIFGKGDAVKKMVKLDAFWQQCLQNGDTKDIQYIDIRFDDQVVVSRKS